MAACLAELPHWVAYGVEVELTVKGRPSARLEITAHMNAEADVPSFITGSFGCHFVHHGWMGNETAPAKGKTWYERDYPVLVAAVSICQESQYNHATTQQVATRAGIEVVEVVKAINNLQERYLYAKAQNTLVARDYIVTGATAEGLEAVDVWPSARSLEERMISILEQRLEELPEGSPKANKISGVLAAVRDLATNTSGNVFGSIICQVMAGGV